MAKENPNLSLDALSAAPAGIFIGAEGDRVPDKIVHESSWAASSEMPWNCGFCRGIAALCHLLATRFGAWLLLVRPSGRFFLEDESWLFSLDFRDNLEIKLL